MNHLLLQRASKNSYALTGILMGGSIGLGLRLLLTEQQSKHSIPHFF